MNILLVDDQPSNLLALEALLSDLGQNLVQAHSGADALKRLLDADFALILLDVQMPVMDGFETAVLVRERDKCRDTPIIFLTAHDYSDGALSRGYSLGAVDFLFKPIIPDVLRAKVSVFVELAAKTEQVKRQAELLQDQQRQEHEHQLAEERQRWQMDHLRAEADREKENAYALSQKAEELARTITERIRAEEMLRARVRQQALMADLGQRALAGTDPPELMNQAVALVAETLNVEYCVVLELLPDGKTLQLRAGVGWDDGCLKHTTLSGWTNSEADFALQFNEPLIVEDLNSETRFDGAPMVHERGVISGLNVVIRGPNQPFGVVGVHSKKKRAFNNDDAHFLQQVATVLATAIQSKKDARELDAVKDQLAIQLDDMTRLHELGARLSNTLDLQTILREVLSATCGLLQTDLGELRVLDREHNQMSTAFSLGFQDDLADEIRGRDACGAAIAQRQPVIVENVHSDPRLAANFNEATKACCQAIYSVPLLTRGGHVIGALAAYFRAPYRPTEREQRLIDLYARQAAEVIDNARLHQEIQEASKRKDEFLAMLAHELRNPLAPIRNALEYIRRAGNIGTEVARVLDMGRRQVQHMARLVDDLLDVSRINRGKIQLDKEVVELPSVIERAVESTRSLFDARSQRLELELPAQPLVLEADPTRLEQVLVNLLTNAAKYTAPTGRVALAASQEGSEVVVRVQDSGIGIAAELLPKIFDLFVQADRSLDRSQGGLGIGLTLVRSLVELHGGSVSARSDGPGKGTMFEVRLPLLVRQPRAGPPQPVAAVAAAPSPTRNILVVDDNIEAAETLALLLRLTGHEVRTVHDGPQALESLKAFHPEIFLLDIGLPRMDGYELAHRLRQLPELSNALLVALSGYGQESDRRRSRESGFDYHLTKPVDIDELHALLSRGRPEESRAVASNP